MRTLRIQTRNTDKFPISQKDIVNIELSGRESETELKDLFSCFIACNPNEIKGLKDDENNYYTLSSVISNKEINSKKNKKIYQLVLKSKISDCMQNNQKNQTEPLMSFNHYSYLNTKENQKPLQNFESNRNPVENGSIHAETVEGNKIGRKQFDAMPPDWNSKFVNYSSKVVSKTRNFLEQNYNEQQHYFNQDIVTENFRVGKLTNASGDTEPCNNYFEDRKKNYNMQNKNFDYYNNYNNYNNNFKNQCVPSGSINIKELPVLNNLIHKNHEKNQSHFIIDNESNRVDFKDTFGLMLNAKKINETQNYTNLGDFNRSRLNKESSVLTSKIQDRVSNRDSKSSSKLTAKEAKADSKPTKENRRSSLLSISDNLYFNNEENKSCFTNFIYNNANESSKASDCEGFKHEKPLGSEQKKVNFFHTETLDLSNEFSQYLKKVSELKLISAEACEKIRLSYAIRSKEFLELYKIYMQGIIDQNSFFNSISILAEKAITSNNYINNDFVSANTCVNYLAIPNKNKNEFNFIVNHKQNLKELINSINQNYFNDPNDLKLLRMLIEEDNDLVYSAYEFYLNSNNYQKFLNALKSILNNIKNKQNPNFLILNNLEKQSNKKTSENLYCNPNIPNLKCELERNVSSKSKKLNDEMQQLQYSPVKMPFALATKNSKNLHHINLSNLNDNNTKNNNNNNNYNNDLNKYLNVNQNKNIGFNSKHIIYCTPKTDFKTRSDKNLSQNFISNNIFFESTRTESKTGVGNNSSSKKLEQNPKLNNKFINNNLNSYQNYNNEEREVYVDNREKKEKKILNFINYIENLNFEKNSNFEATLTEKHNVLHTQTMTFNSNLSENLYLETLQYTAVTCETNELSSENENQNKIVNQNHISLDEDDILKGDVFCLETRSSVENKTNNDFVGFKLNENSKFTREEHPKEKENHQRNQSNTKETKNNNIHNYLNIGNLNSYKNQIKSMDKSFEVNEPRKLNKTSTYGNKFYDSKETEIKIIEFKRYLRMSNLLENPQDLNLLNKLLDEKQHKDLLLPFIDEFLETANALKLKNSIYFFLKLYNLNNELIIYSSSARESISEPLNLNENENSFESSKNLEKTPIKRLSSNLSLKTQEVQTQNTKKENSKSNKKESQKDLKTGSEKKLNHVEIREIKKKEEFENFYHSTHSNLKTQENEHNLSNNNYNHQITFSKNPDLSCDFIRKSKNKSVAISTDNSHDFSAKFAKSNPAETEVNHKNRAKFYNISDNKNENDNIDNNNDNISNNDNNCNQISSTNNKLQKKFGDIKILPSRENGFTDFKQNLSENKISEPVFSFNNNININNSNNAENIKVISDEVNSYNEKIKEPAYLGVANFKSSEQKKKAKPTINSESEAELDLSKNANENRDSNAISKMDSKENILIFNNISSKIIMNNELDVKKDSNKATTLEKPDINNESFFYPKLGIKGEKEETLNKLQDSFTQTGFFEAQNIPTNPGIKAINPFENLKKSKFKSERALNIKEKYTSLNELLRDLEDSANISNHQLKYIMNRYEHGEEMLLSAWEVYQFNFNLEDLIETLKVFSVNARKPKKLNCKGSGYTPSPIAKKKNEIINFLKNRQKEERLIIIEKQINIIGLLAKENLIEDSKLEIIRKLIAEENLSVISAFEILSVAKDFWDFAETIALISENDFNSGNQDEIKPHKDFQFMFKRGYVTSDLGLENKIENQTEREGIEEREGSDLNKKTSNSNLNEEFTDEENKVEYSLNMISYGKVNFKSLEDVKEENENFIRLKNIFYSFIDSDGKRFFNYELMLLNKKLEERNEFLMSSIEFYEVSEDKNEFFDNLKILVKN